MKEKASFIYIYISIAIILWGFSFVWTNELLIYDVPIFIFIFMRMVLAGTIMFVFSKITGKLQKVDKSDWRWFFLMAFFEPFIYFIGESYGLKITNSATLAAVVIATIPIFTLIIEQRLYKARLSLFNKAGVFLTLPGIVLFVWSGDGIKADYYYGIMFLLLAVFGSVGYTAVCKKLTCKYNAITITTYQFIFAALFFLIPFLFFGLPKWSPEYLSFKVLKPLMLLAVLASCFAFVLYVKAIDKLGMTKAAIFTTLIPVVSAVGAFFTGQETFSWQQICGMIIALVGIIFTQYRK